MRSSLFVLLSSAAALSLANPIPSDLGPTGGIGCGTKEPTSSVTVTDQQVGIDGAAIVGAASCKPQDGTKCTLSHSVSYTVSKSVSVGITPSGQTGKNRVIGLAISVSVSWSTAKGTIDGSGSDCPVADRGADQWACALNIIPSVARVSGKQTTNTETHLICDVKENQDYTVDLPIVNRDGNPNVRTELCSCPDEPGFDSPGAPPPCAGPCRTAGATNFAVRTGLSVFKQPVTNTPLNTTFPWTVAGGALNPQQRKDAETTSRMNRETPAFRGKTVAGHSVTQSRAKVRSRSSIVLREVHRAGAWATVTKTLLYPDAITALSDQSQPEADPPRIRSLHRYNPHKRRIAAVSRLEALSQAPDDGRLPLGVDGA